MGKDRASKKIYVIQCDELSCRTSWSIKGTLLSIQFYHFDGDLRYELLLSGDSDHECSFRGRTRHIERTQGGAKVYIPRAMAKTFMIRNAEQKPYLSCSL